MKRCVKCVLPETFPGLTFDLHGVCSCCSKIKDKETFLPSLPALQKRLDEIIEKCKARRLKYDALVAFSGGKDSTYLIYKLKDTYKLKILAFTLDNGFMSEHSFVNMRNVLKVLDVDHIILRPNYKLLKDIFCQSATQEIYPAHLLKFGSSICISCIRMVSNLSLRLALEKKIPMVMLGHSPGQIIQSENEIIYKDNLIPYGLKRNLFKPLADRVGEDIYYYLTLDKEEYKNPDFPYTINTFPLAGYDEAEIYNMITSLGWKRPEDVDPNSSNCRLNAYGIIKHKEKYNFHPYDYEMSMLVRLGIISRDEALQRVEDPTEKTQTLAREVEKNLFN